VRKRWALAFDSCDRNCIHHRRLIIDAGGVQQIKHALRALDSICPAVSGCVAMTKPLVLAETTNTNVQMNAVQTIQILLAIPFHEIMER